MKYKLTTNRRLYWIHRHMLDRCNNEKNAYYYNYGGNGITVCEEWTKFPEFESWAYSNGYQDFLTIDRIDGTKGYSPANCRWVTKAENCRNRSCVLRLPNGALAVDVARANNVKSSTLWMRVRRGWKVTDACTYPKHKKPNYLMKGA